MTGEIPVSQVLSVDVFDTCITRTFAHPRDLFYALGLRLAPSKLGAVKRHRFASRFQQHRIRAEKSACRQADANGNPNLPEIYARFRALRGLTLGPRALMDAEITLERESLYPIPAMATHIRQSRAAGHRIIFISDMYLSREVLGPILCQLGVMQPEDALYVSCDVGCSKHDGKLFEHVLRAEGLQPSQLTHYGDNALGDVRMARENGIEACHARAGMLTAHESQIAGRYHRWQLPRSPGASFLAAFARRIRLVEPAQGAQKDNSLGHIIRGTIVPLLLAYVAWILDQAKRNGINRLYFVARDGEILYRVAQALKGDSNIELRYLYGSRRAWLPPSIEVGSADWQRQLVLAGHASSRHDILERMGLDNISEEAVRNILLCSPKAWSTPLSHDQAHTFLGELMEADAASHLVISSATQKREIALSYFEQEGLLDDIPWALVDAGWSLNSQAALKRILESSESRNLLPSGFYLALARDHLSEKQAGGASPFILKAGSIFSRRRVIVEHCFLSSTHTTTNGYRMEGGRSLPTFGPELRSEQELAYARRLHETATCAAKLIAADRNLAAALNEHTDDILSNAARLLRHPSAAEARAMSALGAVADMRHEKAFVKPLCHALGPKDVWTIISMVLSRKKNFESPSYMWLEGSAALSPWHVRIPLNLILLIDSWRNRIKN